MKYQHLIPQREQDHEVKPVKRDRLPSFVCSECGRTVKKVADNDGPEGLKALLRLS